MHMSRSNISRRFRGALALALILAALVVVGCASKPAPAHGDPVPTVVTPARALGATGSPAERRLQSRIETLQEEVRGLSARVNASEQRYWGMMTSEWQDRVRAAKAKDATSAERTRYLEALEDLLARKLRSLQEELKAYEAYQMSDPLVPRK